MKVYIVIKYNYIDGDLECYVESDILEICSNKELAIKLQKEYILKLAPQNEIEKLKEKIKRLNIKEFKTINFDYDMKGVGIEEYDVREK